MLIDTAQGLDYLASVGVVHGDVKVGGRPERSRGQAGSQLLPAPAPHHAAMRLLAASACLPRLLPGAGIFVPASHRLSALILPATIGGVLAAILPAAGCHMLTTALLRCHPLLRAGGQRAALYLPQQPAGVAGKGGGPGPLAHAAT